MGTITARRRKDGTMGYTAQIRIKSDCRIIHTESQTFDREPPARIWLKNREAELAMPGGLDRAKVRDPTLAKTIERYRAESLRDIGRTKKQVLNTIAASDLGAMRCSELSSHAIVAYALGLGVLPQTAGNYVSHLAAVLRLARPAWGYPVDARIVDDARVALENLGGISRSKSRSRRPTIDELDSLLVYFTAMAERGRATLPMVDLVLFAMFSARRLEEITRLTWADLDAGRAEIMVRDMKHPGEKKGNDVRTHLPEPALAVIQRQARIDGELRIFHYNHRSISAAFTRACSILGIEDLHYHDLRHEGVSWLFEQGWDIPRVALVSGHRTWNSLKRYTQLQHVGDRFENWAWRPKPVDAQI